MRIGFNPDPTTLSQFGNEACCVGPGKRVHYKVSGFR
jgi:hypothetical protein